MGNDVRRQIFPFFSGLRDLWLYCWFVITHVVYDKAAERLRFMLIVFFDILFIVRRISLLKVSRVVDVLLYIAFVFSRKTMTIFTIVTNFQKIEIQK